MRAAAELVVLPADCVARKPPSVDDIDAAAVLPDLTAWEALSDRVHLAPGQRLLVRGGTGAVGAFLTQFAHEAGAEVTVTVSSASTEAYARELGADQVIVAAEPEPGRLTGFVVSTRRDQLQELAALVEQGRITVAIAQTFPPAAGRAAYESGSLPRPRPGKSHPRATTRGHVELMTRGVRRPRAA